MTEEIWKEIEGYAGLYEVSNLGRVRRVEKEIERSDGVTAVYKNRTLSQSKTSNGYYKVTLSKNGKVAYRMVHRLVATAFLDNCSNLPCVNHKDENKTNNCVENLEWCDHSYNHLYGNACAKIRKKVINLDTGETFRSACEAGRKLGTKGANIARACRAGKTSIGFRWAYVK